MSEATPVDPLPPGSAGTAVAPTAAAPPAAGLLARIGGRHALVLGGFTLVACALLAVAQAMTAGAIEQRALEDLRNSLSQVIPASIHDNNPATDTLTLQVNGAALRVYRARRGSRVTGVAFETAAIGYAGEIRSLVGVDADGRLLGVRVLRHKETPGLGDKIEAGRSDWITRFAGLALGAPPADKWAVKKDGGQFDQFAGATITPRAVVKSVRDGLQLFAAQRAALLAEGNEGK